MQAARDREGALRGKESPSIDSATIESDPRALKEEYELAGLSHLGLVGLAFGGITAVTSFTSCL